MSNPNTRRLHDLGQRLCLDGLSRSLLRSGGLQVLVAELGVTGVRSNPERFERALGAGEYDESIRVLEAAGLSGEELLVELALEDLAQAADDVRPFFDASQGVDGWVSLALSPMLADNTAHTIQAAARWSGRAAMANLLITVPGTPEGLRAVEEIILDGVPVEVSMLFSREQVLAAAEACMRGIERRLAAGLDPQVASVASVSVGAWDSAVRQEISSPFHNRLGIAMAMRTYRAHRELLGSDRWLQLAAAGARAPCLQWVGTEPPDRAMPDLLYVQALVAPDTVSAMTETTLSALADHGRVDAVMPRDGGYADAVLEEFRREGVDDDALARRLQRQAIEDAATTWHAMLARIREKSASGPACT